ncbi:complex I NDUFA9 subunit family protein [Aureimonas leprariae]|uniref:Complex I NDUFA9 subunit family protein n=1 Tax=Plantimonas leprariae TaxID=2615207 RepID=A0A7V7PKG4_9HYPH|nr:complex I NDUFA9 subunit family protein [Aureimonas leprariae]KAB0676099.1 complex I NDUFA9 subunit family protein [Aureimonas leprariae]
MAVDLNQTVTVFGGSGFIGRYVARALARRGHRVRIACRRPDLAYHVQVAGNMGQVMPVQANLRYRWTIDRAIEGADHVVNLVGVLSEAGKQTFSALQARGAGAVAEATAAAGAKLTHVSAIGADAESDSAYARSKAEGERLVGEHVPGAWTLRPSIVFGPEDKFFNRFADMAKLAPVLPLLGGGHTRFQPVYVNDVAEAIAMTVDGTVLGGRTYELGGPEVLTFREMMEIMLGVVERRRRFLSIPFGLANRVAELTEWLPAAPLTVDQVKQLRRDNVVSEAAVREGRTLQAFGINPESVGAVLPTYLVRFRPQGQFTKPDPQAGGLKREGEAA